MQIFIVDAFTKIPFRGNPAATVLVEKFPADAQMQKIAAEMNLSETAFAEQICPNYMALRWFTPTTEVNLCGHATLAMAHYLNQINAIDSKIVLKFKTRSGDLLVRFEPQDLIVMDFPVSYFEGCSEHALLKLIFAANFNYEIMGIAGENIGVLLETETQVLEFLPDFAQIAQLKSGLIITAIADSERDYDFVSRFFAPNIGINEDPVTGSTHCALAPFWAHRLQKNILKAKQLSRRSGELELKYLHNRVEIKGHAVTVLEGRLKF